MVRHRFNYLLVMMILLLLCAPWLHHVGAARVVFSTLVFGTLVSAVVAVSDRRNQLIAAGTLVVIAIGLRAAGLVLTDRHDAWLTVRVSGLVVETLVYGNTVVLIVRYVLAARRVTFDMISASLCGYLLLGVVWSHLYILLTVMESLDLGALEPGVFSPGLLGEATNQAASAVDRLDRMFLSAMYVSFVTLTTIGYGDITPAAEAARMLAVVEAVLGQFYLAVLVARLVGLHIAASTTDGTETNSRS